MGHRVPGAPGGQPGLVPEQEGTERTGILPSFTFLPTEVAVAHLWEPSPDIPRSPAWTRVGCVLSVLQRFTCWRCPQCGTSGWRC